MLGIGACIMGAGHVVGFDIDPAALVVAQGNIEGMEIENLDLMLCNVADTEEKPDPVLMRFAARPQFDTVIMNPPFGTKKNAGMDMLFIRRAMEVCAAHEGVALHCTRGRDACHKSVCTPLFPLTSRAHPLHTPRRHLLAPSRWLNEATAVSCHLDLSWCSVFAAQNVDPGSRPAPDHQAWWQTRGCGGAALQRGKLVQVSQEKVGGHCSRFYPHRLQRGTKGCSGGRRVACHPTALQPVARIIVGYKCNP